MGNIQLTIRKDKKVVNNRGHLTTDSSPVSVRFTLSELAICANKLTELQQYCEENSKDRGKKTSRIEMIRAAVRLLNDVPIEDIYSVFNEGNDGKNKTPSRNEIIRLAVRLLNDVPIEEVYKTL